MKQIIIFEIFPIANNLNKFVTLTKLKKLTQRKYNDVMANAFQDLAPHKICAYIYDLANAFNRFYHETKILAEEDAGKQKSYIALLKVTKDVLEACIDVLGFEAPERM